MELLRTARDPWGQETVLGLSWDLLWVFAGAGVAIIVLHALGVWLLRAHRRRGAGAPATSDR